MTVGAFVILIIKMSVWKHRLHSHPEKWDILGAPHPPKLTDVLSHFHVSHQRCHHVRLLLVIRKSRPSKGTVVARLCRHGANACAYPQEVPRRGLDQRSRGRSPQACPQLRACRWPLPGAHASLTAGVGTEMAGEAQTLRVRVLPCPFPRRTELVTRLRKKWKKRTY